MSIERVSIVGMGHMGRLMGHTMFPGIEVVGHDPILEGEVVGGVHVLPIEDVGESDVAVLAVPAVHFFKASTDVVLNSSRDTAIIDVSSVKMFPQMVLEVVLGELLSEASRNSMLCHPEFGPDGAKEGVQGHSIVVTDVNGDKVEKVLNIWSDMGILVDRGISAEEHDRRSVAQALGIVVGRASNGIDFDAIPESMQTATVIGLEGAADLDRRHSDDLYNSMIYFNPFVMDYFRDHEGFSIPDMPNQVRQQLNDIGLAHSAIMGISNVAKRFFQE